jgi:hypothetical protein
MALWGNNDNVSSIGTISLNYGTRVVTGTGTSFGTSGHPQEGDVIRFGTRGGTYFGDGVIVSIASTISCTIGSTMGLDGSAISGVQYTVSECPSYTVADESYSETMSDFDKLAYGTATADHTGTAYDLTHGGWVGVTTYVDCHGTLRVKKETLVAMSGITTGGIVYPTNV